MVNENSVLEDWDDVLNEIIDLIIVQMAIFLFFLGITLLAA